MDDLQLHDRFAPAVPGSVPFASGELHVWAVPLHGDPDRYGALLSAAERQRLDRFRFADHRRRFQITHGALRTILAGYLGESPQAIDYVQGLRGKPQVVGSGLEFNLSHSGKLTLVGVSDRPLGIDVEKVRHLESLIEIARRHFSPREFAALEALSGEQQKFAFYRCWTRKEAYIKALGEGLSMSLDSFDVSVGEESCFLACHDGREDPSAWTLLDVSPGPDFVGAAALRGAAPVLRCYRMEA